MRIIAKNTRSCQQQPVVIPHRIRREAPVKISYSVADAARHALATSDLGKDEVSLDALQMAMLRAGQPGLLVRWVRRLRRWYSRATCHDSLLWPILCCTIIIAFVLYCLGVWGNN
jgi:hypothetical protein